METIGRIEKLIVPSLEAMGFALVRVRLCAAPRRTLQIMIERSDQTSMTVDCCAEASTAISAILDVEDAVSGSYVLEVSSPGIDRPLVRLNDFERFAGCEAKIELKWPIDGRKRFRGRLLGIDGENVRIALNEGDAELPFGAIGAAKLVLTDELIASAQEH
jgi:ribosome maturation factor RimP